MSKIPLSLNLRQRFPLISIKNANVFYVFRYLCHTGGRGRGRRGDLGVRHAHGRCESSAPNVWSWRSAVQRGPALHKGELQGGRSQSLLQGPPTEQCQGLPSQRHHLPNLRESAEALLSTREIEALFSVNKS